CQQESNWYSF
nr:immunoglobulin light chain junction region [Macaca mulatta]MOV61961.1 immunoglobulin light chain junction region [Macaca mulatta]